MNTTTAPTFADLRGMDATIGQVTAAVAARKSILFIGPPGVGATMIARRIPSILPRLDDETAFAVAKIHATANLADRGIDCARSRTPPFRAPHHTVSSAGMFGERGRPGEVSLAHAGVLFLDDVTELRLPILRDIAQVRAWRCVTHIGTGAPRYFPADFYLVGAMYPCPCGWFGFASVLHNCVCSDEQVRRYRARVQIPGLFDTAIELPPVSVAALTESAR